MPETPTSLLDRFLRSDATMYAGLGEITRDYVDKMPLAAPQEAQSVVRLDRDFAIMLNNVPYEQIKIVVECDGHAFHEKTKEQDARDKRRDRDLQIAGWRVLRFTGSEIWRDHDACAAPVDILAMNEIDVQLRRRGLIK